jgi:phosphoribosylformimino-5-aminoimidazole carboxamide ribonucleotide (ProFAR) isomerase
MIIYPAIDLINGECVRLSQGRFDLVTRYDSDPFKRLAAFNDEDCDWIHIVDLDGAKAGAPQQQDLIGRLAKASKAKIQTGGGVRTRDDVQALLDHGVSAVVVGSAAVQQPDMVAGWIRDFGKDTITLALDVLPTKAFSSEVDTGSREEKATDLKAFSSEVDTGSREEKASDLKAFSSEVDTGSREEKASDLKAFSSEVDTGSREEKASDLKAHDFDVAVHGWAEGSGLSLWKVLDDYYPAGFAKRILVTDVSRDGMLMGPNMALMKALRAKRPDLEIQASGGVRSVDDLYDLLAIGVHGAIVGKALYEGLIDLKAALNLSGGR